MPYLEPIVAVVWWLVGAVALSGGAGTVVLAAGLGVTGLTIIALREQHGSGAPLGPAARGRLLRLLGITAALIAVLATLLGTSGYGELTAPLACAMVGVALMPLATMLDERPVMAAGAGLLVLGAVGAVFALGSAGRLYPQGVVGLVAGALLWTAGAHRTGLLHELRVRISRG